MISVPSVAVVIYSRWIGIFDIVSGSTSAITMEQKSGQMMRNRWLRCIEKVPKCRIFRELVCVGAFLVDVLAVLMARNIEIAAPIWYY